MKPLRPVTPFLASATVVAGWWAIAHSGGQGWVQALGDLVFAGLAVGLFGPVAHMAGVRAEVSSTPSDGQVGRSVTIPLTCRRRIRIRPLDPAGAEQFVGPAGPGGTGADLVLTPERRGVYRTLRVQIASAAPFGLQWWGRTATIELPAPLHVAPRPGTPMTVPVDEGEAGPVAGSDRFATTGDLRATRTYAPGDERRRIHWPASAHAGQLMVRELERPSGGQVQLRVRLPEDPNEAEGMAGSVLATVVELLASGRTVILDTLERDGPVSAQVDSRRSAGRRLAAAVATPGRHPGGR